MHIFAQKPKTTVQTASAKSATLSRAHSGQSSVLDPILRLQRTIRNQVILGLLQTHAEEPNGELTAAVSPRFEHDFSQIPIHPPAAGAIQTKLAINKLGDSYEHEADRMAEQAMLTPEPHLQRACPCGGGCPRCRSGQPGRGNESLQTKRVQAGDATQVSAPPVVHEILASPGHPLDQAIRTFMEPRLGFDFGGVRVHRGDAEATATTALHARAFTVGRDIAFAPGEFRPDTASGRRLLAHELTHVVQQTHAGTPLVQRQPKPNTEPWLAQIDDILSRHVGLLAHMHRIGQLSDRFTTDELNELIGLIHANSEARAFTRDEAGVPGIFALQDTRIGNRLDVAAARFLLKRFPGPPAAVRPGTVPPTPRQSDEKKAAVFSEGVVRDAYIRFHYNAILPGKDDPVPADLPNEIRQNCIAIVHALAPQLFTNESVVKQVEKGFKKLRQKGETYTMVHTGEALAGMGVADPGVPIKFKDAAGKTTNGNTEPTTLESSAWDKVMDKVGNDYGWHIFGMSLMNGHHSVTLFVDNQPEGKALFWADQWRIEGEDFSQVPGAISGFRQYEKAGFDKFIETITNNMWKKVHSPDSKCADRAAKRGKDWDSFCRYPATLMLWQLRKVVKP